MRSSYQTTIWSARRKYFKVEKRGMKIGIIDAHGLLGQSIRSQAFLDVLGRGGFDVADIVPTLTKYDKFQIALTCLKDVLALGAPRIKALELRTKHAAQFLDEMIEEMGITLVQAETTLMAYVWTKSKRRCPCIFDMHGLSYEQRIRQGLIGSQKEDLFWKTLQNETITSSDHIFAVSANMADYLAQYVSKEKITIVRNAGQILPYEASFSLPMKAVYAGIFEYWEKIDDLATMANLPSSVKFSMMGDGRLKKKILEMETRASYIGNYSRAEALKKMSEFQIGIATSTDDITRQVASPIKVFDYMSVGLPVIAPMVGEWSDMIRENCCGIAVDRNAPASFIEAITSIDEEKWRTLSANGRKAIKEKFNWDKVISECAFPVYKKLTRP
jgi:glycosyltransferase involved in cell wall biosynthesis